MQYLFLITDEINKINFSEVVQTPETLVYSFYLNKTYVSWEDSVPSFASTLVTKQGPYNEDEFQAFLNSPEWTISE